MSYKVQRVSPSALAATEHCPRFRPDGKENDAAQEGTMLHECLENLVQQPMDQWDSWIHTRDLSAEHKSLLEEAASQLRSILAGRSLPVYANMRLRRWAKKVRKAPLKPGLYPECEIDRGSGHHGYIDLMIVFEDGFVTIVDYKMVRTMKDYSLQLGAYMCDVNYLCPAHREFECRIIAPRLPSEEIETHLWGEEDIARFRARIDAIEERADRSANDPTIVGCPNDACTYCHSNGRCPYQTRAVAQVADTMNVIGTIMANGYYAGEVLSQQTFMSPATPGQRGLRRACVKFLESAITEWKEQDKRWCEEHRNEGIEVPGWKIGWRAGRASLDKTRMPDINAALMSKMGMTREDILNVSSVDMPLLKEHLVTDLGYSEKEASKVIGQVLDPFMQTGGAYTVWTQAKPKPAALSDVVDV